MHKRWWNSHNILDIKGAISKVKKNRCWLARNSRYNTKHEQVCVGGRVLKLPMITQIIEGQGWYFSSWIRYKSWKSSGCCWWPRHICREISRCKQSATTSGQRNDEAKGYWNHGYDTNLKSSLLFKANWYDEEDRRRFSSSSKIVLQKGGPGSTV